MFSSPDAEQSLGWSALRLNDLFGTFLPFPAGIPVVYLQADENTRHYDQKVEHNCKPVVSP
jgi:hypothetical protein